MIQVEDTGAFVLVRDYEGENQRQREAANAVVSHAVALAVDHGASAGSIVEKILMPQASGHHGLRMGSCVQGIYSGFGDLGGVF